MTTELQQEIQSLLDWFNKHFNDNLTKLPKKDHHIWTNISLYQTLSESFIKEHKDLVDWPCISYHLISL